MKIFTGWLKWFCWRLEPRRTHPLQNLLSTQVSARSHHTFCPVFLEPVSIHPQNLSSGFYLIQLLSSRRGRGDENLHLADWTIQPAYRGSFIAIGFEYSSIPQLPSEAPSDPFRGGLNQFKPNTDNRSRESSVVGLASPSPNRFTSQKAFLTPSVTLTPRNTALANLL